jgi:hypothetical protein
MISHLQRAEISIHAQRLATSKQASKASTTCLLDENEASKAKSIIYMRHLSCWRQALED